MKPTFSVFNIMACCWTTADTQAASVNTFSVNVPDRDHLLSLGKLEWLLPCPAKDDITFCKLVESSVLTCTCRDKQFDRSLLWNLKPRTGGEREKKNPSLCNDKNKVTWEKPGGRSGEKHQQLQNLDQVQLSESCFFLITSLTSLTVWNWGSLC